MLKRRLRAQGLITCGLLGALVGCSSSDGVGTPTPIPNQDPDRLNLPTHTHSAIVTTEGAGISAGEAEVVIPRGALAEPVEIVVQTTEGGYEAFPSAAEEQVLEFLPHGTQFLAPVMAAEPIDVIVETLRETYRMIFLRGTVEQRGATALAFSGTIKKASAAK